MKLLLPPIMDSFKVIGFTLPTEFPDPAEEAYIIRQFLSSGAVDNFHIRKNESSIQYTERLLNAIGSGFYDRLVLHSHFSLAGNYNFKGIHLKADSINLSDCNAFVSRSCHSLDELKDECQSFVYSFLSPIYDSISKVGYRSGFSLSDTNLRSVVGGLKNVIALGGVSPSNFHELFKVKFAGAALLGYLWSQNSSLDEKINEILVNREKIKDI